MRITDVRGINKHLYNQSRWKIKDPDQLMEQDACISSSLHQLGGSGGGSGNCCNVINVIQTSTLNPACSCVSLLDTGGNYVEKLLFPICVCTMDRCITTTSSLKTGQESQCTPLNDTYRGLNTHITRQHR